MDLASQFPLPVLSGAELKALFPLMVLPFGALVAIIAGTHKEKGRTWAFLAALISLLICLVQGTFASVEEFTLLGGALELNNFTRFLGLMTIAISIVASLLIHAQSERDHLLPEIQGLLLFSTSGMLLMLASAHLIFMFIALEIMSLAVYVMVAMKRSHSESAEAGLKYFVLGGVGSALLLYGSALIFGATGTFTLPEIAATLRTNANPSFIYYVGAGLVLISLFFKVGAFPFHGWLPDVYQGAPTAVTGFMGAAVKFTAFMALARVCKNLIFIEGVPGLAWFEAVIWIVAAWTMVYGNFVAVMQSGLKRMLAYSTIAHTGYLLIGLYAMGLNTEGMDAMTLYLFFYAFATLGAFGIISSFEDGTKKDLTLAEISGLGYRHPFMAIALTIFLLSMAGIPLTSGFIAKYGLFSSAVKAGEIPLVILAVLTSVVSVYYYLRVIVHLFMKSPEEPATYHRLKGAAVAVFVSAVATVQFGLFPASIIQFVRYIAR